jgi:2-oxoglutarate ferredoxin oxidoreductase subunit alpha
MTSSSSPGISLMGEAISYMAGAEIPVVIVNIMRSGPGLGGILPSQGDYLQATKGAGHGDYRVLVLAPSSVQEAADLMMDAFALADRYRNPVLVLGDGLIGQMMEPVEFRGSVDPASLPPKPWATTGCKGRPRNIINSLYLDPEGAERHVRKLLAKYQDMAGEVRHEEFETAQGDLDVLVVAYGTVARIVKTAIDDLRGTGARVGLFRPITLYPFPSAALAAVAGKARAVLVTELSGGQMVEDVRAALPRELRVEFYGRLGGNVVTPEEVIEQIRRLAPGD